MHRLQPLIFLVEMPSSSFCLVDKQQRQQPATAVEKHLFEGRQAVIQMVTTTGPLARSTLQTAVIYGRDIMRSATPNGHRDAMPTPTAALRSCREMRIACSDQYSWKNRTLRDRGSWQRRYSP
jgi:hypothetical protein